jgi:hypothetical protein
MSNKLYKVFEEVEVKAQLLSKYWHNFSTEISKHLPVQQLMNKQQRDKEMKNWIVVIACVLVGALGCIKFLEDTKNREKRRQPRDNRRYPEPENFAPVVPLQPITAVLCLIVPAYVASNLKGKSRIDSYEIEQLIDNASYFLCTKVPDAEKIRLAVTNENILEVSEQREVYIKIEINDAQEILDQKVPYILKRNLPTRSQGVIKESVCLKNLSGLETFNRV